MTLFDPEVAKREQETRYLRQKFGSVETDTPTVFHNADARDTTLMPKLDDYSTDSFQGRNFTAKDYTL